MLRGIVMRLMVLVLVSLAVLAVAPASAGPEGQMTLVLNISTAARWFDPSESEALITPFLFYFMIHDALVKPLPGQPMAPCLAESWSASADGLTYEFVLRKGVRFHNGEPVTPEDVKFSFERYMEPAILAGYGPRVAESAIGLITNMAGSAPYEELRLKTK